jgi:hypothetical protein
MVLSVVNQFLLPNCVFRSESVSATELWCQQQISFCCRMVLTTMNPFSLLNCDVGSKAVFPAELWCP